MKRPKKEDMNRRERDHACNSLGGAQRLHSSAWHSSADCLVMCGRELSGAFGHAEDSVNHEQLQLYQSEKTI